MADDLKTVSDAAKFHEVMGYLQDMQMQHGTCHPRERMACTHCNARDKLNRMLAEYTGAPMMLS